MKKLEELSKAHDKLKNELICETNKRLKELFPENGSYAIEDFQLVISTGDGNLDVVSIEVDWEFVNPIDLTFIDGELSLQEINVSDLLAFYELICKDDFVVKTP